MNIIEDFDTALPQNHKNNLSTHGIMHELTEILDIHFSEPCLLNRRYVELYIVSFLKYLSELPDWRDSYNGIMAYYATNYQTDIFNTYLNTRIKTTLEAL